MDIYHIYKITHWPTNRCYIGVSLDPRRRFKQHQQKKNGSLINEVFQQFPIEEFVFEILCCTLDRHHAYWELEPIFIKDHQAHISQGGFNRTYGGGYAGPKLFNETHREKLKLAQTGKRLSEQTRQKMSQASKGKPRPWAAKHITEWNKKFGSATRKGKPSKRKGRKFGHISGPCLYHIQTPIGILTTNNLVKFAEEHGIHRVTLYKTKFGKAKKGFQILSVLRNAENDNLS